MAQDITIAGASYSDVPSIEVPKTGGGVAEFVDTSDADATADDVMSGVIAYSQGRRLVGTNNGGRALRVDLIDSTTLSESYNTIMSALLDNRTVILTIGIGGSDAQIGQVAYAGSKVVFFADLLAEQTNEIYRSVVTVDSSDVVTSTVYKWSITGGI